VQIRCAVNRLLHLNAVWMCSKKHGLSAQGHLAVLDLHHATPCCMQICMCFRCADSVCVFISVFVLHCVFKLCCLPFRPSYTCRPVGGHAIWPGDMVHTGSKGKTDINDYMGHSKLSKLNSYIHRLRKREDWTRKFRSVILRPISA
jgi:hypothetical protein